MRIEQHQLAGGGEGRIIKTAKLARCCNYQWQPVVVFPGENVADSYHTFVGKAGFAAMARIIHY